MRWSSLLSSLALVLFTLGFGSPALARPGAHTVRVEGAGALQVGDQFSRFGFGGGFGAGYEYRIIPEVGIEARYHAFFWPVEQPRPGTLPYGGYHGLGVAGRFHPLPNLDLGDLWIDAGVNLVLTGDVARPGIEIGVGFEFELAWFLRLGPFVRFAHVFQPDEDSLGPPDSSFLEFGVSVAFPGEEPVGDRDHDGIADPNDQCPDEPEDIDGVEDENGCPDPDAAPATSDTDTDGDGIFDSTDRCPRVREDHDGFQDEDGCVDPDNDNDTIDDQTDRCPMEPETRNGHEDADGCPDETPDESEMRQLTDRIFFPHDRVRPTGDSHRVIQRLAELIQAHPEWVRIRIEGHASDTGEPEYNMNLSRRRAERIRELLVQAGVDASRLEVQAYGSTRPDVQGDTEQARAANRRVSFTVIERR